MDHLLSLCFKGPPSQDQLLHLLSLIRQQRNKPSTSFQASESDGRLSTSTASSSDERGGHRRSARIRGNNQGDSGRQSLGDTSHGNSVSKRSGGGNGQSTSGAADGGDEHHDPETSGGGHKVPKISCCAKSVGEQDKTFTHDATHTCDDVSDGNTRRRPQTSQGNKTADSANSNTDSAGTSSSSVTAVSHREITVTTSLSAGDDGQGIGEDMTAKTAREHAHEGHPESDLGLGNLMSVPIEPTNRTAFASQHQSVNSVPPKSKIYLSRSVGNTTPSSSSSQKPSRHPQAAPPAFTSVPSSSAASSQLTWSKSRIYYSISGGQNASTRTEPQISSASIIDSNIGENIIAIDPADKELDPASECTMPRSSTNSSQHSSGSSSSHSTTSLSLLSGNKARVARHKGVSPRRTRINVASLEPDLQVEYTGYVHIVHLL